MPIDTTNYGREIKSLRAEISELRTEISFMYSALQNIQEQFGFALAEISNLIRTSDSNRKNDFEKIQTDFQEKFDDVKKELSENENQSARYDEQKKFFADKFAQLEKISDAQQINFGNHFDAIENSVAAQQKMFQEIFSQQNSEVIEKISKVGVSVEENQKTLTKNFDGAKNQQKDIYKLLGSLEELLRLIAANQMLDEVENNLPTKNNFSQKSSPKVSSDRKKKIYIYGRGRVGKTTLADILQRRIDNIEITETLAINRYNVSIKPSADKIIYVIDESELDSNEVLQFIELSRNVKKILLVVNVTAKFPSKSTDERIYKKFKNAVGSYLTDWEKIFVVYVYLQGAESAWTNHDYGKFQRSNFIEIENFINEN